MTGVTNKGRTLENIVARAIHARNSGRWPAWNHRPLPNGVPTGSGWARDFRRLAENGVFCVLIREVDTAWGAVAHAMISSPADKRFPSWAEKQRIKNEIFGRERVAVEVFPPVSELVDCADAFHLWVLPAGMSLPFTLKETG